MPSSTPAPTILLRSSWQTCNIGDIAHTLGVAQLLGRLHPNPRIILWPSDLEASVIEMLRRQLPDMEILNRGNTDQIDDAIQHADLFLHGSGPGVVGRREIEIWRDRTDKPFGLFGVTVQDPAPDLVVILNDAAFLFTRETESLEHLRLAGCTCPVQAFTPDGVFAMDIRNVAAADAICEAHGLEPGKFICAIPRLRYTPYHLIREVGWNEAKIHEVTQTNEAHRENDAKRLHEPIVRWVRETGMKVLVCPEMTYQLDLFDSMVIDPLPEDVKPHVVALREYWLPDAAQAVYDRAACVVSMECHSPIMALAVGTPAFYLRQPQDTIKGRMYYDLGLERWTFEIEQARPADIADRLMEVYAKPMEAKVRIDAAVGRCDELFTQALQAVGENCGSAL